MAAVSIPGVNPSEVMKYVRAEGMEVKVQPEKGGVKVIGDSRLTLELLKDDLKRR